MPTPNYRYPVAIRLIPTELTDQERALQAQVRAFCDEHLPRGRFEPGLGMSSGPSKELSRELGRRGWLGMALPKQYGGSDRSTVDRLVVVEELLRRGAPLEQHWTADRQSGVVINRSGTEEQKRRFLPQIAAGELCFCIGMSEPDSGSDLASVQSRAVPVEGGWKLNGTKIWTSNAHFADWMICLCRTHDSDNPHQGLSQLLIDMKSPGITINPIVLLDGTADFAEVVFEDEFVPEALLLGQPGNGWEQVTSELSFERAGPERWITPVIIVENFLREHAQDLSPAAVDFLGHSVARWWGLRQVSLSVARMIDEGKAPALQAAMGKDMGTEFEQDVIATLQQLVDIEPSLHSSSLFSRLLARAVLVAPSWVIRGGTNEVLKGIIAKGLR